MTSLKTAAIQCSTLAVELATELHAKMPDGAACDHLESGIEALLRAKSHLLRAHNIVEPPSPGLGGVA